MCSVCSADRLSAQNDPAKKLSRVLLSYSVPSLKSDVRRTSTMYISIANTGRRCCRSCWESAPASALCTRACNLRLLPEFRVVSAISNLQPRARPSCLQTWEPERTMPKRAQSRSCFYLSSRVFFYALVQAGYESRVHSFDNTPAARRGHSSRAFGLRRIITGWSAGSRKNESPLTQTIQERQIQIPSLPISRKAT